MGVFLMMTVRRTVWHVQRMLFLEHFFSGGDGLDSTVEQHFLLLGVRFIFLFKIRCNYNCPPFALYRGRLDRFHCNLKDSVCSFEPKIPLQIIILQ